MPFQRLGPGVHVITGRVNPLDQNSVVNGLSRNQKKSNKRVSSFESAQKNKKAKIADSKLVKPQPLHPNSFGHAQKYQALVSRLLGNVGVIR